jgi:transcriptional regulator with XRE-family HTH domain
MSENTRNFCLFIDGLRLDRHISREELIDGIVSLSQYKRYLRGAASIPNSVLIQIADRLKLSISGLHHVYESKQNSQLNKISNIYTYMKNFKFNDAYSSANKIRDDIFISSYNKLFFDFCLISIQHNLGMVSDIHALEMYSTLIDYPECIENETFNWIEINILMEIVKVSSKMDNFSPSNHMYKIVTSPEFKFLSSGDSLFIPTILSSLSPILGKQQKFEEVLVLAKEGIDYCRKYQTSGALATLFLTEAFALVDLNRIEEAKESSKKALMQIYIEDNVEKFAHFKKIIMKRIDLTEENLKFY